MNIICHITTHMGGGVGKTLSNIAIHAKKFEHEYQHIIICLEEPEKRQFIDDTIKQGVPIYIAPSANTIYELMAKADVVQIEWWHHPFMTKWLETFKFPDIRLVIWSHVSGHYPPIIPEFLIPVPDVFLFTTPYTYESPYLESMDWDNIDVKTGVVFGSGGFDNFSEVVPKGHNGFNIGYVGTLDFSKLHPNYVNFCAAVGIPDTKFVLVGDTSTRSQIEAEATKYGILENYKFVGYTDDVPSLMAQFDVFGYPLNPEHFGASENALLEAMASMVPPVVLNQAAEKHIVKHMETGLLVRSAEEYGEAIRYLYNHPEERIRLGQNARKYVLNEYSVKQIVAKLNSYYEAIMFKQKKNIAFKGLFGSGPTEWFLSCLGNDKILFENSINDLSNSERIKNENNIRQCRRILRGKTKSSVLHFLKYFPEDRWLKYWSDIINK